MANVTVEQIKEVLESEYEKGHKLIRLNHFSDNGTVVKLDLEEELLPYIKEDVDLLSPHKAHERNLIYLYVEECIQLFPSLKEQGNVNKGLLNVMETLLLALDYLTHERFINAPFTEENKQDVSTILNEYSLETKTTTFSNNANRPLLVKSKIMVEKNKIYCMDERKEENKYRLYLAVSYLKPESKMEEFKQAGHWLGEVNLKPDRDRISYEESLEGKTNHELHTDLIFYLNMVKRAFSWLLNSYSWRNNEWTVFDEIDVLTKLGIK